MKSLDTNLKAMASNPKAMASKLLATASNLLAMASNLHVDVACLFIVSESATQRVFSRLTVHPFSSYA